MLAESTIAVVEDDADARVNVCRYFQYSGFNARGADSAEDFYVQLRRLLAHPVVADEGLPGKDVVSLVRRQSARGVPTILTTARADLECHIDGLEAAALACFDRPVDLNGLVAGVCSQLRRSMASPAVDVQIQAPWRIDLDGAQLVAPNQRVVSLTARELKLLQCLMEAKGGLVTKQALVDPTGAGDVEDGFHRIESQLARLRRKTLVQTGADLPVRAVFGKGLVFVF